MTTHATGIPYRFQVRRQAPLALFVLLTLVAGCECHRKSPPPPNPPAPLAQRKAALEEEIGRRLEEIDRASQRMERESSGIDEKLKLRWNTAMDQLRESKNKVSARIQQLANVDEAQWQEFHRDIERALDELDLLREDAEATFKEKTP